MEKTHQEVVDLTFDNFFGTTSLLCIILSVSGVFGFFNYLATESIPDEEMEHVQFLLKATVCLAIVLAVLKFVSQQLKDFFNKTEDSKEKFPMFDRLNLIFGYSGIVSLTFIFFAHLWVLDLTSSTIAALYGLFWHIFIGLFCYFFVIKPALKYDYTYKNSSRFKIFKWSIIGTIIGYQFHRGPCFLVMYFYYIIFFYFFLIELITVIHGDAVPFLYDDRPPIIWKRKDAYVYENEEDPTKIRVVTFYQDGIYTEQFSRISGLFSTYDELDKLKSTFE
ncbi:hypothetical protein GCK72_011578 [Caenorhabditis remanei]|uniref:Uncharacterized protein n=1 Tax=Caenorhabditis remanei TaxID=31234 RepID=A0A6A5HAA4_CAERE|nr:hypothetical protein GCK72_011578 [Caenorhabditis remanei]KAF1763312.1 hypothetical protein GCK72_011578 [Caenorhabditis remanei]